jgi:hypothetical protein
MEVSTWHFISREPIMRKHALAALIAISSLGISQLTEAASISYVLDQTNIDSGSIVDGVTYGSVTIDDNTPNSLRFTVYLMGPLTWIAGSNFGIDNFAFNVLGANPLQDSGSIAGQWTLPSGWASNVAPPPNQSDGFGRFDVAVDGTGANRQTMLVFSLNNTALNLYSFAEASTNNAGQGNVFFSAHIAGINGPNGTTSGYFGGSTLVPVPLPAALPLFLSALFGGGFLAKWRKK